MLFINLHNNQKPMRQWDITANKKMKKLMLLFLTCFALAAQPLSAEIKSWSDKGHGYYCDKTICHCTVYYDTDNGSCYAMVDGTKCDIFKVKDSNTYNAAFRYDGCTYFLLIQYWPM